MNKKHITYLVAGISIIYVVIASYLGLLTLNVRSISYLVFLSSLFLIVRHVIKKQNPTKFFYAKFACLTVLLFLLSSMLFLNIYPFGDRIFSTIDLFHQYTPFLNHYQDIILKGKFFFYDPMIGFGTNFLAFFAYYLASPFHLLLVLVPKTYSAEAIVVLIVLKIALTAFTFSYYLQEEFKQNNITNYIASIIFASMTYLVGYSWNIIWLDCFYLFPLIMIGYRKLINEDKPWLYVISLSLSIFSNYYISYMICLYVGLHFILEVIIYRKINKKQFIKFSIYSILSASIWAFMLLPTIKTLAITSSASKDIFPAFKINFDIASFLVNHNIISKLTIEIFSLPALASSTLAIVALFMFLGNKRIKHNVKVFYMILYGILAISMFVAPLDFIWHGFHIPNGLPYRYSFLYVFVMVTIVFIELNHFQKEDIHYIWIPVLLFLGSGIFLTNHILQIGLTISIMIILWLILKKGERNYKFLTIFIVFELLFVTNYRYYDFGIDPSIVKREDSFEGKWASLIYEASSFINKTYLSDSNYMYKTEIYPRYNSNPGLQFQYNGLTTFSSMNHYNLLVFLNSIGVGTNHLNSITSDKIFTYTDTLLGLKYYISKDKVSSKHTSLLKKIEHDGHKVYIYENKHALSVGYMVDEALLDYDVKKDVVESTNDFFKKISNINEDVLIKIPFKNITNNVEMKDTHTFYYTHDEEKDNNVQFISSVQQGNAFVYVDAYLTDDIKVEYEDETQYITPYYAYFHEIKTSHNTEVIITLPMKSTSNIDVYVIKINEDVYDKMIEKLSHNQLQVTNYQEDIIEGTIESNGGLLFTRIPYEEGWSVYVDGIKKEITPVSDALIAFYVEEGKHKITLKYRDNNFYKGMIISSISVFILLGLYSVNRYKKKHGMKLYE